MGILQDSQHNSAPSLPRDTSIIVPCRSRSEGVASLWPGGRYTSWTHERLSPGIVGAIADSAAGPGTDRRQRAAGGGLSEALRPAARAGEVLFDRLLPAALANSLGDQGLIEAILARQPWMVGFTCYLWNVERTLWIAQRLKQRRPELIVLLGGPEITADNAWVLRESGGRLRRAGRGRADVRRVARGPRAVYAADDTSAGAFQCGADSAVGR